MRKKFLSVLLTLAMVLAMVPATAFAADEALTIAKATDAQESGFNTDGNVVYGTSAVKFKVAGTVDTNNTTPTLNVTVKDSTGAELDPAFTAVEVENAEATSGTVTEAVVTLDLSTLPVATYKVVATDDTADAAAKATEGTVEVAVVAAKPTITVDGKDAFKDGAAKEVAVTLDKDATAIKTAPTTEVAGVVKADTDAAETKVGTIAWFTDQECKTEANFGTDGIEVNAETGLELFWKFTAAGTNYDATGVTGKVVVKQAAADDKVTLEEVAITGVEGLTAEVTDTDAEHKIAISGKVADPKATADLTLAYTMSDKSNQPNGTVALKYDSTKDEFSVDPAKVTVNKVEYEIDVTGVTKKAAETVAVTGVTVAPTTKTIAVGEKAELTVTIAPENATDKTFEVVSDTPDNATAEVKEGKVIITGVKAGTAKVTVTTTDGNKTAECAVTVENVNVTGVTLNSTKQTLLKDATFKLVATVAPENATNKEVTFASSDTAVATVAADGTVTAVKAGTATITATTTDGGKTATCAITVSDTAVAATAVTLDATEKTIEIGETFTLKATVEPEGSTDIPAFASEKTDIATVDAATGVVTGVAAGTAVITVTAGEKTATCTVTVNEPVEDLTVAATAEVPASTVGTAIEKKTIAISGGTKLYKIAASDTKPGWLNVALSADGDAIEITGTPTLAGDAVEFTITVTDSTTPAKTATVTVSVGAVATKPINPTPEVGDNDVKADFGVDITTPDSPGKEVSDALGTIKVVDDKALADAFKEAAYVAPTPEEGKEALEAASKPVTPEDVVRIVVETYVEVTIKEVTVTEGAEKLLFDVTPKYVTKATTAADKASMTNDNTVEVAGKNGELTNVAVATVTLPVPADFAADGTTVYLTHKTHSYELKVASGKVTFVNKYGFSEMALSLDPPAGKVANVGGQLFDTLQEAVGAVEENGTITLTSNITETSVTIPAGITKFSIVTNGNDISGVSFISAKEGYVVNRTGTSTIAFEVKKAGTSKPEDDDRPSSSHRGGGSHSLDEIKGGRYDNLPKEDDEKPVVGTDVDPSNPFVDVATSDPYYEAIMEVYKKGWMVGISENTFASSGTLTRGMAAQILWNKAGNPSPTNVSPFLDVTSDKWYATAVAWAYEQGLVLGYDGTTFGPDDFVTTEQFTIMLDKAAGRTPAPYVGGAANATRGWVANEIVK